MKDKRCTTLWSVEPAGGCAVNDLNSRSAEGQCHRYSRRTPRGTTGGPADDGGSCPHRDGDCLRRPGYQSSLHSAGGRANLRRRLVRIGALGSLSLIFWLLIITISTKCWLFVMRADNHGEAAFSR
jgi:K+ potassium transporter